MILNWSWLSSADGHRAFERFSGDLLDLEFVSSRYTPNATRAGRDGGADGLYSGSIAEVPGPWKIASAIRKDLQSLKRKIREENKSARKRKFRGLLFLTSLDVTPTQLRDLNALAGKGLKRGIVWARAKLEQLIKRHPWLAAQYFLLPLIPGFVPVTHPLDQDSAGQSDIALVGRKDEEASIVRFVRGRARVLVIVAGGGAGTCPA
jgi:hypothetical protein